MTIHLNYPDKILAGLHQSYTLTSDEGAPAGTVELDGKEIPHRVIRLGPPKTALESTTPVVKYKIAFLLPEDCAGKTLTLRFQAGSSKIDETKQVIE